MDLIIGLLTFVLFLTSLFLGLLILVQLPKKEAGAGLAFGGAASDALFGAGSGTVLTKLTKYAAGIFLGLSLFLSVLRNHQARASAAGVAEELQRQVTSAAQTLPVSPSTPSAAESAVTIDESENAVPDDVAATGAETNAASPNETDVAPVVVPAPEPTNAPTGSGPVEGEAPKEAQE